MSVPPTLEPPHRPATGAARASRRRRRRVGSVDVATVAWPIGLALLLTIVGIWRVGSHEPAAGADAPPAHTLAPRSFDDLRLPVPRTWTVLDRQRDRITWGDPARTHTVTLAATDAASLPLVSVVRAVAEESRGALPGTRIVEPPRAIDPDERLPRGDSVVLVGFEVDDAGGPVRIVQAWRRDSRAGRDIVATWTSTDGTWPADPRVAIASATGP